MRKIYIGGFTLLEGIVVMTILCGIFSMCYHYTKEDIDNTFIKRNVEYAQILNNTIVTCLPDFWDIYGKDIYNNNQYIKYTDEEIDDIIRYSSPLPKENNSKYIKTVFLFRYETIKNPLNLDESDEKDFYLLILLQNKDIPIRDTKLLNSIVSRLGNMAGYIEPNKDQLSGKFVEVINRHLNLNPTDQNELRTATDYRIALVKKIPQEYRDVTAHNLLHRRKNDDDKDDVLNTMETDLYMDSYKIIFETPNDLSNSNSPNIPQNNHVLQIKSDKLTANAGIEKPFADNLLDSKINNYSGAELSAWWYKLPYYQVVKKDEINDFANNVCKHKLKNADKSSSAGRFFCCGEKNKKVKLFWCSSNGTANKLDDEIE